MVAGEQTHVNSAPLEMLLFSAVRKTAPQPPESLSACVLLFLQAGIFLAPGVSFTALLPSPENR